jgi:ribosomal 30S subunit maturation factor RimM
LENKTWKVDDIAGSKVFTETGEYIGVLDDVLPTGGNDIWVIKTDLNTTGEILMPALKSIVKEIDVDAKKITVALPAGLKEVFEEHCEGQKKNNDVTLLRKTRD